MKPNIYLLFFFQTRFTNRFKEASYWAKKLFLTQDVFTKKAKTDIGSLEDTEGSSGAIMVEEKTWRVTREKERYHIEVGNNGLISIE
ncbi:hypothetical protein LguiA_028890 [Lonicera macranthoides]